MGFGTWRLMTRLMVTPWKIRQPRNSASSWRTSWQATPTVPQIGSIWLPNCGNATLPRPWWPLDIQYYIGRIV